MARNQVGNDENGESSLSEGVTLKIEEGRAPMPSFAPGEFDRTHVAPDVVPLPVLPGVEGKTLWRSVEERAELDSPERLTSAAEREFPMGAADFASDGIARRSFIQLLGSSLAVAGVSGCAYRPPDEKILPYTVKPEAVTPSSPLHFATTSSMGGLASGLLVQSYEGRPVKVEGNPLHPANPGGGSNAFEQAETLRLYDPHRAKELTQGGSPRAWKEFLNTTSHRLEKLKASRGAGLRFLMEPNGSPLLASLKTRILEERFPLAKFYSYAQVSAGNAYEGARLAFGQPMETDYDLKQAKVVLSLDADFLASFPGCQRLTHAFTAGREPGPNMNRLYSVESSFSVTGAFADHRLRVKPSELGRLAAAIASELASAGASGLGGLGLRAVSGLSAAQQKWARAVAKDLHAHRGASAVLVGARQPAALHALAQAINAALGNQGKTVLLRKPLLPDSELGLAGLTALAAEIRAGRVDTLVITAYNPVYAAPADLELGALLAKIPNVIYWGMHEDETAKAAQWFIPAAHFLEAWGDAVGPDGTASLVQPLIKPLFSGVSEADLLGACLNQNEGTYALLKAFWKQKVGSPLDFETRWESWLAEGRIPATEVAPETAELRGAELGSAVQRELLAAVPTAEGVLELNIVPDYKLYDGRFGNNAWMQELPDPITKITWDNVAYLSEATAKRLDLTSGDLVTLSVGSIGSSPASVEAPVWVLPGHADDTVTVSLGYGRSKKVSEKVAREVGFNAYQLQTAASPWTAVGLKLAKTGKKHKLASTQEHWSIHLEQDGKRVSETRDRDIAMETTLEKFLQQPDFLEGLRGPQPMMYEPVNEGTYRWAMATDLSKCTGCNACVIACQSENNVPVVGKDGIARGREMHWLRIDRYFSGSVEEPGMITQPVACVHCEMAPCEYVCPVNATVHDDEGLNEMIYNRCIGTRYCSNNCPYKVRRFNFLAYNTEKTETEKMGMNPQVTVRARGVMEKCTYCVQRIESKRIETRIQGRRIKDGELTTACAQACSGDALVFGDLNDPESKVSKLHRDKRRYDLLHHLATKPRTAYLARIKNPNPELA